MIADPGGVGHHVPEGRRVEHHQHDDPHHQPVPQAHPGEAGGDACGKGVDRAGQHAGPAAQQHHGDAHQGVISRRGEHGDQKGVEGHGLLPHAEGGAPQAEEDHQHRDEEDLPAPQQPDHIAHPRVNGPGGHDHTQKAAHHQDEQRHVHRVVEPLEGGQDHVPGPLGLPLHLVVGAGHGGVLLPGALIGAGGNDPGSRRHQDQQKE